MEKLIAQIKVIGNTSDTGYRSHDVLDSTGISTTLMSRDYKGPKQIAIKEVARIYPDRHSSDANSVIDPSGISHTVTAHSYKDSPKIVVNQLGNISNSKSFGGNHQTGRVYDPGRFKTNGEPEFTLTGQDRHGIYDGLRIRKLTPRETWRLQGFPDWAFDKAKEAGLSNSQLYKQAGNAVTVPVIYEIAKRMNWEDDNE